MPGATHVADALEKLAWHEYARGHSCCAEVAWRLAVQARSSGWVAHPEKMAVDEGELSA